MSFYGKYPPTGSGGGGSGTVTSVDVSGGTTGLTTSGGPITTAGTITIAGTLGVANGGTGVTSLGNLTDAGTDGITVTGGTGAVVTNVSLSQHVADSTHNGYLSSTDWNTFNGKQPALTTGNLTDVGTDGITVTGGTGAVIGSGTSIAQHVADTTHNGYLSSTDWNTFNNKQPTITTGNLTDAGTDGITVTGGTGAVIGSGTSIAQQKADATHNGYLSSGDWSTFNGKGSGSVTSVAMTVPSVLSVSGTPITTSGTLAVSYSGTALPVANGGTGVTSTTQFGAAYGASSTALGYTAAGSTGQVLIATTSSAPSWAFTNSLITTYQTSSNTAVVGTSYLCNTTSAAFTMTLPAGSAGAVIRFADDAGTWATNNLTIAPHTGETIQGISGNGSLVVNLNGAWVELAWDSTNSYWVVIANGFQYGPTATNTISGISVAQKQYVAGTAYTNGTPNVTCAQSGFAVDRGVLVPYQTYDGAWRLRFNIAADFTSATITTLSLTITGVTFKSGTHYFQPVSEFLNAGSLATTQGAYANPNSGVLSANFTSTASATGVMLSGDVELDLKPTWAD